MSFDSLGLAPELLRAVADQGYTEPTPVQAEAIPLVLEGRDVLAGAQTGTGKTAAFVLPILQRLHAGRPSDAPAADPRDRRSAGRAPIRCLILTPTRELALQVEESVRTYGARRPIRSTVIYGGVGFDAQVRAVRAGPEIVVATPGRLLDHVGQRTIDLSRVEILVLDEADRMLDMGFIRDIRKILALLPARRQNLLFSATFSNEIRRLADGILDRPAQVQVTPRNTTVELVRQVVHPGRPRAQARAAEPPDPDRPDRPGAGLHPDQARREPPGRAARAGRDRGRRDPRQQEPAAARPRPGRLQVRPGGDPGRDRHRGPRDRHRRPAPRRQLRAADGPRGLRPSDRPDRPGRDGWRRGLAGLRRRVEAAVADRGAPADEDPGRGRRGLRAGPIDPAPADPSPVRRRRAGPGAAGRSVRLRAAVPTGPAGDRPAGRSAEKRCALGPGAAAARSVDRQLHPAGTARRTAAGSTRPRRSPAPRQLRRGRGQGQGGGQGHAAGPGYAAGQGRGPGASRNEPRQDRRGGGSAPSHGQRPFVAMPGERLSRSGERPPEDRTRR